VYITFSVKVGNNIDYFAYDSPSNRFNKVEKRFQVRNDSGYQHYFHRNSPTYVSWCDTFFDSERARTKNIRLQLTFDAFWSDKKLQAGLISTVFIFLYFHTDKSFTCKSFSQKLLVCFPMIFTQFTAKFHSNFLY
jgi:hypothetical protein